MMPQDYLPDVERDHSRQDLAFNKRPPLLGEDGLPILMRDSREAVLNDLSAVIIDRAIGFEALSGETHLAVRVFTARDTYTLSIDDRRRCGLSENVIAVLGIFGECNAARQQRAA